MIVVVVGVLSFQRDPNDPGLTLSQVLTGGFASATALGALIALVIGIRRQALAEDQDQRQIEAAFTERFREAARQLGAHPAAERMAGVYALSALTDDYSRHAQQCVDVLCGYLRLPFDPDIDHLSSLTIETPYDGADGGVRQSSVATRPNDGEVRSAIMSMIAQRTRRLAGYAVEHARSTAQPWSLLTFDLTGAVLPGARLEQSVFLGPVSFTRARFYGEFYAKRVHFLAHTSFHEALFEEPATFATCQAHRIDFSRARFQSAAVFTQGRMGGFVSYVRTSFNGKTTFAGIHFEDGVSFRAADFRGVVKFSDATVALLTTDELEYLRGTSGGAILPKRRRQDGEGVSANFEKANFSQDRLILQLRCLSGAVSFRGATGASRGGTVIDLNRIAPDERGRVLPDESPQLRPAALRDDATIVYLPPPSQNEAGSDGALRPDRKSTHGLANGDAEPPVDL